MMGGGGDNDSGSLDSDSDLILDGGEKIRHCFHPKNCLGTVYIVRVQDFGLF